MKIGRNDPCWCGSGKKYKSCHAAFDDKLAAYQLKHIPVPSHKLIKTPEQLEGIRKAGKLACPQTISIHWCITTP